MSLFDPNLRGNLPTGTARSGIDRILCRIYGDHGDGGGHDPGSGELREVVLTKPGEVEVRQVPDPAPGTRHPERGGPGADPGDRDLRHGPQHLHRQDAGGRLGAARALVTDRLPLEAVAEAFATAQQPAALKVVVDL
jgi:hypothetical protein